MQETTTLLGHGPDTPAQDADETINAALEFVRSHLQMEVAYLSEFVGDELVFRAACAPGFEELCAPGIRMPLDQVYCQHILEGRLPELIPDTTVLPLCQTIPATNAVPIKSHVSVPIYRRDGTAYGMFCCLSRDPSPSLNDRDLEVMRAFAKLSADQVNEKITTRLAHDSLRARIEQTISTQSFDIAYQPICALASYEPKGYEALCRFQSTPYRPPNLWFEDAAKVGCSTALELSVLEKALGALTLLPAHTYISVNASPAAVESGQLADLFRSWPCERIVLELTEHAIVSDYSNLIPALEALRFAGIRLAIDDAGAGYSGLQHIVKLKPDIIKLDRSLVSEIDKDLVRRSLAAAMVRFASETDAAIIAEGVETADELATLRDLGVPLAQGYHLGRPAPLDQALNPSHTRRA